MVNCAVLFARSDSIYKSIPGCDVFDIERDARTYSGSLPVIAHPPCRAWGRLRTFAKPRHDEKALALFAVDKVRDCGGVLEHPAHSSLWEAAELPGPAGGFDAFGGFTLGITQHWFGHRAEKATFLYIVGIKPQELPDYPMVLGDSERVVSSSRFRKGEQGFRSRITTPEREKTPEPLARWLVDLCNKISQVRAGGAA